MNRVLLVLKGMAMGFADVIPGVSGGTLALITGIYVSFLEAIKSLNINWIPPFFAWVFSGFKSEKRADFVDAFLTIHWGFLIPLGVGIVLAFGLGSVIVPELMIRFPEATAAFFIGLILASVVVPARMMTTRGPVQLLLGIAVMIATFFALGAHTEPSLSWVEESAEADIDLEHFLRDHPSVYGAEQLVCAADAATANPALLAGIAEADATLAETLITHCDALRSAADIAARAAYREEFHLGRKDELNPFNTAMIPAGTVVNVPRPTYLYIFMSGVIGICAMVLPGVSGSFFLLVLGVYQFMLSGALKGFVGSLVHGQIPVIQAPYVIVFCFGCLFGVLTFARVMSFLFKRFPSNTMAAMVGLMLGSLRALWPFKVGEPHTGVQNVMPPLDATLVAPVGALLLGAGIVLTITWLGSRASSASDTGPGASSNE